MLYPRAAPFSPLRPLEPTPAFEVRPPRPLPLPEPLHGKEVRSGCADGCFDVLAVGSEGVGGGAPSGAALRGFLRLRLRVLGFDEVPISDEAFPIEEPAGREGWPGGGGGGAGGETIELRVWSGRRDGRLIDERDLASLCMHCSVHQTREIGIGAREPSPAASTRVRE